MLFNSTEFFIFFPLVTLLYFATPHRLRWLLLLIASYYFYMSWRPSYIILILFSTMVDFFAANRMSKTTDKKKRKRFLLLSLSTNLGLLFFFKYFNFFSESLTALSAQIGLHYTFPTLNLLLPVGISFYTFQTLSYTIDVYRGRLEPERRFGIFALFVSFFPQLVAGPIERASQLLPQFYAKHYVDYQRISEGIKLMTWGLFKKVVIADRLAVVVNTVYNNPSSFTGVPLILATFFFAFQIYCDFSGYTDIAIGAAKVLGFDLMENFRQPYFSRSIGEFWRRWHISLSTWFRDYVYIPMGGNRVLKWHMYFNLMIVFLVSGLWHGASWTFVFWGALHGFYMVASLSTDGIRSKLFNKGPWRKYPAVVRVCQIAITFLLVCFAWIFFRANSISDAIYIVQNLFVGISLSGHYGMDIGGAYNLLLIMASLLVLFLVDMSQALFPGKPLLSNKPTWVRWAVYYALLFSILLFGEFGITEFIYFQF